MDQKKNTTLRYKTRRRGGTKAMLIIVAGTQSFPVRIRSSVARAKKGVRNKLHANDFADDPTSLLTIRDNGLRIVLLQLLFDIFKPFAFESPQKRKD